MNTPKNLTYIFRFNETFSRPRTSIFKTDFKCTFETAAHEHYPPPSIPSSLLFLFCSPANTSNGCSSLITEHVQHNKHVTLLAATRSFETCRNCVVIKARVCNNDSCLTLPLTTHITCFGRKWKIIVWKIW